MNPPQILNNLENPLDKIQVLKQIIDLFEQLVDVDLQNPEKDNPEAQKVMELLNQSLGTLDIFKISDPDQLIEKLIGVKNINSSSPLFRIKGLLVHDIKKPFIMGTAADFIVKVQKPEDPINMRMFNRIKENLYPAITWFKILINFIEGKNDEFTMDNIMTILKYSKDEKGYYKVTDPDSRINYEGIDKFPSLEMLLTVSTLTMNSVAAKATNVKVSCNEFKDKYVVEVIDNATGGNFPQAYIEQTSEYYELGKVEYSKGNDHTSGGAQIVAFLAGQRVGKFVSEKHTEPLVPYFKTIKPSPEEKGVEIVFSKI